MLYKEETSTTFQKAAFRGRYTKKLTDDAESDQDIILATPVKILLTT